MKRKKQIILLAHCILNVNSKVYGLAGYKSSLKDLVGFLMDQDTAMIQLPCPELEILGLKRWGHVKDQLDYPFFRVSCRSLLDPMIRQIRMYREDGYVLRGVIGIDGSPCCGVRRTCRSSAWSGDFLDKEETWEKIRQMHWAKEPGIFMEMFQSMLREASLSLPFFAVDETDSTETLPALIKELAASFSKNQSDSEIS
ncbi:MAG: hypothetical protein M0T82_11685 [Desulfobacteraceae bacterium]|nr:hypothetical protein [Desulfobacteraceae bacterium]